MLGVDVMISYQEISLALCHCSNKRGKIFSEIFSHKSVHEFLNSLCDMNRGVEMETFSDTVGT